MKDPSEYPIIKRNGRIYSFLDCKCDTHCLKRDCPYCAFEIEGGGCPAIESDSSVE